MTVGPTDHRDNPPLIAHVVYRFDYGGLENGIVNLINSMRDEALRHCVVALTEATDFRRRLKVPDVGIFEIKKRPGKDLGAYVRFYRLMRRLRPAVLHTRNIGTLDCAVLGRLAGVSECIHGEHGWDVFDLDGTNRKFRRFRRLANLFVSRFLTVSNDLSQYLVESVGIPSSKVTRICNGVDTDRFSPGRADVRHPDLEEKFSARSIVIGSVLRFQQIKDPMNLVRAFIIANGRDDKPDCNLVLAMIGDGELRRSAIEALEEAGLTDSSWLPGSRDDIAEIMRSFDLFVLGSRREGISNTLLEAMATGLPIVATDTGGNKELVQAGQNGVLVATEDAEALADAILHYARDSRSRHAAGAMSRQMALSEYSLDTMTNRYRQIYREAVYREDK